MEPHLVRQSPLLIEAGFRHAFFTRHGGVSEGPYESLNFSFAVGDDPERVEENLERAAAFLEVERTKLFFLSQVHGNQVVTLEGNEEHSEVLHTEGDALVSQDPTVACAVRTADCVPVLFADRKSGRVAAAHAGWRGLVCGVIQMALDTLPSTSSRETDIVCAIGPHISVEAFEVSSDVAEQLAPAGGGPDVVRTDLGPKPHVDLRKIARAQLEAAKVPAAHIDDVPGCTFRDSADFFSYRRDGKVGGRHLSAIVPRG